MTMNNKKKEAIEKLKGFVEDIRTAMLTTIDGDVLRSRPMDTQEIDENGKMWFLTGADAHKDEEIRKDNRVNVSYASPDDNTFVSISGTAEVFYDKERIAELWEPLHKAWFPEGKDDPNIRILTVQIEQAEYWDSSSSTFVQIFGFLKALATGESAEGGENKKINL